MQIKMRYNHMPTRRVKMQNTAAAAAAKSLQSCLTLCDPMDCSPPGFSVHRATPNSDEDVEQQSSRSLRMRMENGTAYPYKTKHTLPIRSCNYAFWSLSREIENSCPEKPAHRCL